MSDAVELRFTIYVERAPVGVGWRFEVRDERGYERSGRRLTGPGAKRAAKRLVHRRRRELASRP